MTATAQLASFAHEGLLVSLRVPDGWDAQEITAQQVRFFGPEQPDHDDYRPTMSFQRGEPEGAGEAWFDAFCAAARERLETYTGYAFRRHERFTLPDLVECDATWYEWDAEPGMRFAQVQALISVDVTRMYLINGATLLPLADEFLPQFDQVLHDIRLLPPR